MRFTLRLTVVVAALTALLAVPAAAPAALPAAFDYVQPRQASGPESSPCGDGGDGHTDHRR